MVYSDSIGGRNPLYWSTLDSRNEVTVFHVPAIMAQEAHWTSWSECVLFDMGFANSHDSKGQELFELLNTPAGTLAVQSASILNSASNHCKPSCSSRGEVDAALRYLRDSPLCMWCHADCLQTLVDMRFVPLSICHAIWTSVGILVTRYTCRIQCF
jgi:hypothetical protein